MMASAPLLAGLDVGTTSIKAVVYDRAGNALSRAAVSTPTHTPRPGWASYDAEELWAASAEVLRAALAGVPNPEDVRGIAVASVGEAVVPLAADGTPTGETIAWYDTRTYPQVEWLDREIGKDRLFAISGVSLQPIFSLCKLLWLKQERPEAWAQTTRVLFVADYIAWRLSGEAMTDYSLASRTLMFDLHRHQWSREILDAAGIDSGMLAPLAPGGTPIGPVTPAASAETGLPTTCVVATGGHDHVCGALAAGVTRTGQMLNSLGTAEAVFLPLAAPITDAAAGREGFAQGAHVIGDLAYCFGGQYTSGACVTWARDLVAAPGETPPSYDQLFAEAAAAPAGSLGVCFLPHLRLANAPYDDPKSRGAFIGLSADVKRGALVRSVLEGLAFETAASYDALLRYPEAIPATEIIAIGGGARNELLMRIKATVMGQPILVVEAEEATALGAALLGGLGAGVYTDIDDALGSLTYGRRLVEPLTADAAMYEAVFREVFLPLYPTIRPLSHASVDIQRRLGPAAGRE
ncbi:MAG: FGGY-family carbohydrate kinase [Thermomicrobiales bacterium]